MPRGDKAAIMRYEVPKLTYQEQEKIAGILEVLDRKIQLNAEINDNLTYAMSQAKQRRYQPSGACSRKAEYRRCFIGRMPNSSQPKSCERSWAA